MNFVEVATIVGGRFQEGINDDGTKWASIGGVEVRTGNGLAGSALAFGKTKTIARNGLAARLSGATLIKNFGIPAERWEVTLPTTISARV